MIRKRLVQFAAVLSILPFSIFHSQNLINVVVKGNSFDLILDNQENKFAEKQEGHFIIRDYYDFLDESSTGMYKLPSRNLIIAIPPESSPTISVISSSEKKFYNIIPSLNPAVELLNDSTVIMKEVDYEDRKPNINDKPLMEFKGYFWFRDFYCVHLKLNTHKYDESQSVLTETKDIKLRFQFAAKTTIIEHSPIEIKSPFDENLRMAIANNSIAEQFRSGKQSLLTENSGNWINYGANYLKLGTVRDGLYRITKQDLEDFGINTSSINPETFQLFESGQEKPIYVFGENDLSFDNGDYVEFYGTMNYSKISGRVINADNKPYNNYLDKYTDTTTYFLTWGNASGQRALIKNNYQPSLTDTIIHYTAFIHSEQNIRDNLSYQFHNDLVMSQFPYWDTGKGWYWMYLATWGTPRNFNFSLSDIIPNKYASFFCKLTGFEATSGYSNNVHLIKLFMNDIKIDSQLANKYQRVLLNGSISSNSLINGSNTLKVTYNVAGGSSDGTMLIDWVEAEYPRKLKRTSDSLYFEFRDITSSAQRIIKIENVTAANYFLYKIKPTFQRITAFSVAGGYLYFSDTLSNGDAYFLIRQDIALKPKFFKYKTFVNLRSQTNQIDYIGITHPAFYSSVASYVNYVSSYYSVTANLYSVEDIFDEFAYGYPTDNAIKDFILYKFQSSPIPKPSYLLLFGDANYDYKKYRFATQGIVGGGNFIPSYGFPVSDQYFAVWDSTGFLLPQMYVGRIPINNVTEMDNYRAKVINDNSKPYDDWNKKYLFFSGGRANYSYEVEYFKSINDSVINNFLKPPPFIGKYAHFYKTTNPFSDFGPFSQSQISSAIDDGGVFVSYIGHSGTATWDNGVANVLQLKNKVNRNPVISDFGCSTNKFAEPDIVSFGERFIVDNNGQALAYIGNSALGFYSSAIKAPGNFYMGVILDTIFQVGKAHIQAKNLLYLQYGSSNAVNQFSLSNTVLGDPIVKMKIPTLPNLAIKQNDVIFDNNIIYDYLDSIKVRISLNNYGTVIPQTFKMTFQHSYANSTIYQTQRVLTVPNYRDTLTFWVNVKNRPGQHTLIINLDTENSIPEIYENDNNVTVQFNVSPTIVRDLFINRYENPKLDSFSILNPFVKISNPLTIQLQISDFEDFSSYQSYNFPIDTFVTKLSLTTPPQNNRSWIRYKIQDATEWSIPLSYSKLSGSKYFLGDNYSWEKQNRTNIKFENDEVKLTIDTTVISIISAGDYFGKYCLITKNGVNLLTNTFFQGIGLVVFDAKTMNVDTTAWYELFNNPSAQTALVQLINSIPANKLVALGVATDAKNNYSADLNSAIASLGGTKFGPQLQFKAPYALFGWKNANPNQVRELIKTPFEGIISIDSSVVKPVKSGYMTSSTIGPSSEWKKLKIAQVNPNNSEIKFRPIGVKQDGTTDTLSYMNIISNEANLSGISAVTYPYLKICSEMKADSLFNSPVLQKLEVDYKGIAELGINFQSVIMNKDTLKQGEKARMSFYTYNIGEATAKNFKIKVEVLLPNNSSEVLLEQMVDSLVSGAKKLIGVSFVTEFETGDRIFKINIDSDNQIFEYYKDNNVYLKPFVILKDTTKPVISLLVDGQEIMDGDFVDTSPNIRIELNDQSPHRTFDNNSLSLHFDNHPISLAKNTGNLNYTFSPENPKMVVEYKPILEPGEHVIKVLLDNYSGNSGGDTLKMDKRFIVSNEMAISNIYNYPNPASENTYFTFELAPQLPSEVKILIYTLSGRLVKKIVIPNSELFSNFNKIFWDTRDEDGDLIASGTYFYQVIMNSADKTESTVHKLAIVRQ